MSHEPQSRMDALLKAYAKKRRDQAGPPLVMHPATRELLHCEARRLHKPADIPSGWFTGWPRLAWVLGIFSVLGIAGVALFNLTSNTDQTLVISKVKNHTPMEIAAPQPAQSPAPLYALKTKDATAASEKPSPMVADATANQAPISAGGALATTPTPVEKMLTPGTRDNLAGDALRKVEKTDHDPAVSPITRSTETVRQSQIADAGKTEDAKSQKTPSASVTTTPVAGSPLALGSAVANSPNYANAANQANSLTTQNAEMEQQNMANIAQNQASLVGQMNQANSTDKAPALALAFTAAPPAAPAASAPTGQPILRSYASRAPSVLQERTKAPRETATITGSVSVNLLANFQWSQSNGIVRIVDADGSIYDGILWVREEKPASKRIPGKTGNNGLTSSGVNANPALEAFSFQVEGFNRLLNQNIAITGNGPANFKGGNLAPIPFYRVAQSVGSHADSPTSTAAAAAVPDEAAVKKITGQIRVGPVSYPFEAVPVKPPAN